MNKRYLRRFIRSSLKGRSTGWILPLAKTSSSMVALQGPENSWSTAAVITEVRASSLPFWIIRLLVSEVIP